MSASLNYLKHCCIMMSFGVSVYADRHSRTADSGIMCMTRIMPHLFTVYSFLGMAALYWPLVCDHLALPREGYRIHHCFRS